MQKDRGIMIRGKAINYGSAAWVNHTYQYWKCNHEKNLSKLQKYTIHQGNTLQNIFSFRYDQQQFVKL